ncbi:MAG: LemA family protein [Pseudomonadota bacterium]
MSTTQIITWVVLVTLALWMLAAYNRLVRNRNEIANAFAQIDVQLKRRYDLIPNLVDVARKYVQHERDTLEAVIAARNSAKSAGDAARARPADPARIGALAGAEGALAGLMKQLAVVVEAYPELKADATLRELNEELGHTENRIAFARQAFNDSVLDYNNAAQQAPTNVVAGIFGFKPAAMLEVTTTDAERSAVRVAL